MTDLEAECAHVLYNLTDCTVVPDQVSSSVHFLYSTEVTNQKPRKELAGNNEVPVISN